MVRIGDREVDALHHENKNRGFKRYESHLKMVMSIFPPMEMISKRYTDTNFKRHVHKINGANANWIKNLQLFEDETISSKNERYGNQGNSKYRRRSSMRSGDGREEERGGEKRSREW